MGLRLTHRGGGRWVGSRLGGGRGVGRRLSPVARVHLLTCALLAATVGLLAAGLPDLPGVDVGLSVPWPVLAVGFALAEIWVVQSSSTGSRIPSR